MGKAVNALPTMGMVLGVVDVECAGRTLIEEHEGYAVYQFDPCIVAEVKTTDDNSGFRTLAQYIGVFGKPKNASTTVISKPEPIAMTTNCHSSISLHETKAKKAAVL